MSDPTPSGSLGPVAIIAGLLLLLGAGAYIAMTQGDDAPPAPPAPAASETAPAIAAEAAPVAAPEAPDEVAAPVAEDGPTGPARPAPSVPSSSTLAMASGPKVTPDTHSDAILATLAAEVPKFQACAAGWTAKNPKLRGKAFFVFDIDGQGRPADLSLQFKSVRDEDVDACFTAVLGRMMFPGAGSKVFWPANVGGDTVFAPLGAAK